MCIRMAEALMTFGVPGPKGDRGATGAKGATGATGPQGPAGPAGASASYTVIEGYLTNKTSANASGVKFAILMAHDDFSALFVAIRGTTRYFYRTGAMQPIQPHNVVSTSSSSGPYNGYTTVTLSSTGTLQITRSADSTSSHLSSFIAFT